MRAADSESDSPPAASRAHLSQGATGEPGGFLHKHLAQPGWMCIMYATHHTSPHHQPSPPSMNQLLLALILCNFLNLEDLPS